MIILLMAVRPKMAFFARNKNLPFFELNFHQLFLLG